MKAFADEVTSHDEPAISSATAVQKGYYRYLLIGQNAESVIIGSESARVMRGLQL